jgi:hypothetical protein
MGEPEKPFMTALSNAFRDANGDFNVAEGAAALGALAGIGVPVHDYLAHGTHLDVVAYGSGLGLIIAALGAAQRLRGDPERDRDRRPQ